MITIFGAGYVGLATAVYFVRYGESVQVVDINATKVEMLSKGKSPFYEKGLEQLLKEGIEDGALKFTTDVCCSVSKSNMIFIAVGTPSVSPRGDADLSALYEAAHSIGKHLNANSAVVIKSTVPVGTAEEVGCIIRQELKLRGVSFDVDVISSPEFLREGQAVYDTFHPDRVIIGAVDTKSYFVQRLSAAYYSPILLMDNRSAELAKYACNAMLATRISFMNEMANLAEKLDVNIDHVREAMGMDPRIGRQYLNPGWGYGGSCLPKDVGALLAMADRVGSQMEVVNSVCDANAAQLSLIAEKVLDRFDRNLTGKKVAIWGVAFKGGTDDIRMSPVGHVVNTLVDYGCIDISIHDPLMDAPRVRKELLHGMNPCMVKIVNWATQALIGADVLIILTDSVTYRTMDLQNIVSHMKAPVVFDWRNIYTLNHVNQGMDAIEYHSVGRPTQGI